jgi:hypothetical protein
MAIEGKGSKPTPAEARKAARLWGQVLADALKHPVVDKQGRVCFRTRGDAIRVNPVGKVGDPDFACGSPKALLTIPDARIIARRVVALLKIGG